MKKANSIFLTVAAIITVQFYAGAAFGKVEPVVLRDGIDVYRLDRHLEILEDEKGEWTIDDVTSTSFADRFKLGEFNLCLSGSVFCFRFRVKSESSVILPLEICSDQFFLEQSKWKVLWSGIYFGIILGMVLYNLFLFNSLRDRCLLFYVLYVICIAIYFAGLNGFLAEYILPKLPELSSLLILSFLNFALFWVILFAKSFLGTKKHVLVTDKFLTVLMVCALALVIMTPFVGYRILIRSSFILAAVIPLELIIAGSTCLKLGYRPARFFLIAFATVIAGELIFNLTLRGMLQYNILTASRKMLM